MPQPNATRLTLAEIREVLQCTTLVGEDHLTREYDTVVASDSLSAVLAGNARGSLLVTGLANIQSVRTAHVADVSAIIYIRGVRPTEQTIEFARQKGIVLLCTRRGMFHCCGVLWGRGLRGVI